MTGQETVPPVAAEAAPAGFTVVAGDPTPAELAAVTAVLGVTLEELASEHERAADVGTSAWQRSQRPVRKPIVRGHDAWRGFSG